MSRNIRHAITLLVLIALIPFGLSADTLKVMQLNTWIEGNNVPHGRQLIADRVADYAPDILLVCEIQHGGSQFRKWFPELMAKHKLHYVVTTTAGGTQIASRYPILNNRSIPRAGTYAVIQAKGRKIHVCSVHLYYRDYACYLPRGYHGDTWKKIKPVTDVKAITDMNLHSKRYIGIRNAIEATKQARENNELVIIAGDFNEPSHLDWTERTKNLFDHHGVVMPWHATRELNKAGFIDTYRTLHPDEVKCPAFTFPINNTAVSVARLAWAPLADERDRIDFIFYHGQHDVTLQRAGLMGPQTTILRGKRDNQPQTGDYLPCNTNWPTDHAATFAEFKLTGKR